MKLFTPLIPELANEDLGSIQQRYDNTNEISIVVKQN